MATEYREINEATYNEGMRDIGAALTAAAKQLRELGVIDADGELLWQYDERDQRSLLGNPGPIAECLANVYTGLRRANVRLFQM